MLLYKYRNFNNIEFALDIFMNERLYASNYKTLNDPMEGHFIYSSDNLGRNIIRNIRGEKAIYNILSLSETFTNMVMWSYYSDGHKGFVVGVEITDLNIIIEPVQYVDTLKLKSMFSNDNYSDIVKEILLKKLKIWQHEEEHRCLVKQTSFVKVKIMELIFGVNTSEKDKEMLSVIAKKFCPKIKISTLDRISLETGKVHEETDMA